MNEKLELLKKLLEMGADIDICFVQNGLTEDEAKTIIEEISKVSGNEYYEASSESHRWFRVRSDSHGGAITASIFHDRSTKYVI